MEETNGAATNGALIEAERIASEAEVNGLRETVSLFSERIAELELAVEDQGWDRVSQEGEREFSREFLRRIVAFSRLMFLKNPLINRGVTVQAYYVFGQGVSIGAQADAVDGVIQAFMDDRQNQAELTSHSARTMKEQALQIDGNVFLVLFTSAATGRVRVRSLPTDEVAEIVANPEDAKEPWFYVRQWTQQAFDPVSGQRNAEAKKAYYPDWRYRPSRQPTRIGEHDVLWDSPVYHIKVGGLDGMRFGLPETYAALDWARAYKSFLEDWATITRALARFAWRMVVAGGPKGAAAARAKLNTSVGQPPGSGNAVERNPAPLPGSTWITGTPGSSLEPIRTAGATTSAEDGRGLRLMVAAAMGLPDTFFGDADQGTLATAKSLDRPTELKFKDRQTLWADVLQDILQYVVDQAVIAPKGALDGRVEPDANGETIVVLADDPATGEPADRHIAVAFPPILEHDVGSTVHAIATAATLDGHPTAGTFDLELTTRLLLEALGVDDIDEIMARLFPPDEPPEGGGEPSQPPQNAPPGAPRAPSGATDGTGASGRPDEPEEARGARARRGRRAPSRTTRPRTLRGAAVPPPSEPAADPAPIGEPLPLDDAGLDLVSSVGEDDLARAERLWKQANAGTSVEDLFAATAEPEG